MKLRPRFSLATLRVATALVAAGIAFLVPRAASVRQTQFALSAIYGQAGLAFGSRNPKTFRISCGETERQLWNAAWWDEIDTIYFQTTIGFTPRTPTEKELAGIRSLATLRRVELYNPLSPELIPALAESSATVFVVGGGLPGDDAIARLANARQMREFIVHGDSTPSVTPDGLLPLTASQTLEILRIHNMPSFGDAAIPVLEKFDQLEELDVRGAGITFDGLERLRQSLPCTRVLESAEPAETAPGSQD